MIKSAMYERSGKTGGNSIDSFKAVIEKAIKKVVHEFQCQSNERSFVYEEDIRSTMYGYIKKGLLKNRSYFSDVIVIVRLEKCVHKLVTLRAEYPCQIKENKTDRFDIVILDPTSFTEKTDPYGFDPRKYKTKFESPIIHTLIEIKLLNPLYRKGFNILEKDLKRMKNIRSIGEDRGPRNLISLGFYQDTKENFIKFKNDMSKQGVKQIRDVEDVEIGDYIYLITSYSNDSKIYQVMV